MSAHWLDRPEAGGRFGIWLFRFIALRCGRRFTRMFLCPVALYFFLRRGPERRASRDYFRHIDGRPGSAWQVLRLIHAFGATILDRVFLLARGSRGFEVTLGGVEELRAHLARGRGVLLLGAHVGSFDVLRAVAEPRYKLHLVMDRAKTPDLTVLLEALAPEWSASVIDTARGGTDIVLALAQAAREGGMIALLGDRARPHEWTREAMFLGAPAPFPAAPWLIASLLEVPVVLCIGMYLGGNRYEVTFETLAERVELPRTDKGPALDACIGRYAGRLEWYLRRAPYNWFNFYDFWQPQAVAEAQLAPRVPLGQARVS